MRRIGRERGAAVPGFAFVALYVGAFFLGIEVGPSDREILDHYADEGSRRMEAVAFFLIAGAALSFVCFAAALRGIISRTEPEPRTLASVAWAGAIGTAALVLAGNAVSRATAFAAMDEEFQLAVNTRSLLETAGFLLFVSAAYMAILLVGAVAIASLRHAAFPRWLGWTSVVTAVLLVLAIAFVGFLVLLLWVLAVSVWLARRPAPLP